MEPKRPVDGGRQGQDEKNEVGRIEERGLKVPQERNAAVDVRVPKGNVALSYFVKSKGSGEEKLGGNIC